MTEPVPALPPGAVPAIGLETFWSRVQAENPFLENRINGPSASDADAGTVHQTAFERLIGLAGQSLRARRGLGVVLWGEAGVGKSHLLSRLARWALPHTCFVYLHNLQASPQHLPRSLLRAALTVLTRGQQRCFDRTPLFGLVHAGIVAAVGGDLRFHSWDHLARAFTAWVDSLSLDDLPGSSLIDRSVFEVLYYFYRSAHRARLRREDGSTAALAVRWLSGQALDPQEARALNLQCGPRREEPVVLADAQQIKQVLAALARLAACQRRPLILAFDQMDNLEDDQAAALARFLEALLDAAPGLLTITAGVQTTLLGWHERRIIQDSAWDRLAQFQLPLQRLSPAEAEQVVAARLATFLAPFAHLEPVQERLKTDPLFPLGKEWAERCLGDRVDVRPRDVVSWAREGWREQQERLRQLGGPAWMESVAVPPEPLEPPPPSEEAIDQRIDEWLETHRDWRRREPPETPLDADQLAGLLLHLLQECRDDPDLGLIEVEQMAPPRRGVRPSYDLALLQPGVGGRRLRTGVLVLSTDNANSAAGFLRRLRSEAQPLDRLCVVYDQRSGLPLGERGQEYLEALRQGTALGLAQIGLSEAEYVELEALQTAVRQARSGDLEVGARRAARALTAAEVIESHRRRGRYQTCRLLRELLTVPQPPAPAPRIYSLGSGATKGSKPEPVTP